MWKTRFVSGRIWSTNCGFSTSTLVYPRKPNRRLVWSLNHHLPNILSLGGASLVIWKDQRLVGLSPALVWSHHPPPPGVPETRNFPADLPLEAILGPKQKLVADFLRFFRCFHVPLCFELGWMAPNLNGSSSCSPCSKMVSCMFPSQIDDLNDVLLRQVINWSPVLSCLGAYTLWYCLKSLACCSFISDWDIRYMTSWACSPSCHSNHHRCPY